MVLHAPTQFRMIPPSNTENVTKAKCTQVADVLERRFKALLNATEDYSDGNDADEGDENAQGDDVGEGDAITSEEPESEVHEYQDEEHFEDNYEDDTCERSAL